MRIRGTLLTAILLASYATSASATVRITGDRGGQIGHYLQTFASLRASGEQVVIDGNCLSACTLILGMIPHNRMCATPRARFGFHAAWMPGRDGEPVTSIPGTHELWKFYPSRVRHWIMRHGGLSRHMIYMQGRDLAGIVPSCGEPNERRLYRANLRHRYMSRAMRYGRAASANDRR
jgi:hypothetical protein